MYSVYLFACERVLGFYLVVVFLANLRGLLVLVSFG